MSKNKEKDTKICYICKLNLDKKDVQTHFGHLFCSNHCIDAFNERNDYGGTHIRKWK